MRESKQEESLDLVEALKKLSKRECEVLDLIAKEKTSAEIADELYLSKRTVENHRYHICKKIGLSGRGALVNWITQHWNNHR